MGKTNFSKHSLRGDKMDYVSILKELGAYSAVSGYEKNLSNHIKKLFEAYCDTVEVDRFYNVIGIKKGMTSNKKIMITAHYDEIGLLVKSIDEAGFLRISNIGGIDAKILLAQEVTVHGKRDIAGVIGAKPPHLLKPEEAKKAVKMEDLYVDTGMGINMVKDIVTVGDAITLKAPPSVLQGNKVSSKSIDNRASIVAMLEIMKHLNFMKYNQDVYFVATTQEETGASGAAIASYNVRPDIAIVIDACHGDMPDSPKDAVFALGKGPAIGVGPNLHKKLSRKLIEISKEYNIPYQIDVEPGDTGTEAWVTQVSRAGIPTVLVSIPVRYMHTAIETVHVEDIKNTGKLASEFIVKSESEMEELLCF